MKWLKKFLQFVDEMRIKMGSQATRIELEAICKDLGIFQKFVDFLSFVVRSEVSENES